MTEVKGQLNQEKYKNYIQQWKIRNKKLIEDGKCRKIFLENLLKRNSDAGKEIDWKKKCWI